MDFLKGFVDLFRYEAGLPDLGSEPHNNIMAALHREEPLDPQPRPTTLNASTEPVPSTPSIPPTDGNDIQLGPTCKPVPSTPSIPPTDGNDIQVGPTCKPVPSTPSILPTDGNDIQVGPTCKPVPSTPSISPTDGNDIQVGPTCKPVPSTASIPPTDGNEIQTNVVDIRAAVDFLKEKILQKGPASANILTLSLSQTTKAIREAAGRNKDGLLDFVKCHPDIFIVSEDASINIQPALKATNTPKKLGDAQSSGTNTVTAIDVKTNQVDITLEAVRFLRENIIEKGPASSTVLAGCLGQTTKAIREAAGRNEEGLLNFVKSHPETFIISKKGIIDVTQKVINTSKELPNATQSATDTKGDVKAKTTIRRKAVTFLKEKLMQKGPISIDTLQGCLSRTTAETREAAGKTKEGLLNFLKGNPTAFSVSKEGVIDLPPKERAKDASAEAVDPSIQNVHQVEQMNIKREAVDSLEEELLHKGAIPGTVLAGSLSQTTKSIHEAAGTSAECLMNLAKGHPNTVTVLKERILVLKPNNQRLRNCSIETVPSPYKIVPNHEVNIIKQTVILLLANQEMDFKELLSTLTEMIPECREELSSDNLLAILDKYDLFEKGKTGVCLKEKPSEGYITKFDLEYGFINKTTGKQEAFFHQSAVYIPPQAHVTNELDYQLKVKSCVKYISVSDCSISTSCPPRRAVLVWLTGGPNMMRLSAQLKSSGSAKLPAKSPVPAKQLKHALSKEITATTQHSVTESIVVKQPSISRLEKSTDGTTVPYHETEKRIPDANPTLDILSMVLLFMSILKHKVTCISRLVLARYSHLPPFVTNILTDASLCRAFTSRYPKFLHLSHDASTLSLLHLPNGTSEWSMKNAQITSVRPNSAIADSNDGRVYVYRQDYLCCDSTSSNQSMEVPRGELKSALNVGDKITCLTVPYQVPVSVTVLPGAESSSFQTILAWRSAHRNTLDSFSVDRTVSQTHNAPDKLKGSAVDQLEELVVEKAESDSSLRPDPLLVKNVSVHLVTNSSTKESIQPDELVLCLEDTPTDSISSHTHHQLSVKEGIKSEKGAVIITDTTSQGAAIDPRVSLACSINQRELEKLEKSFVSLSKTVAATDWTENTGLRENETTLTKLAEGLLYECKELGNNLSDLGRNQIIREWMDQSSACIQSNNDSSSFTTCSSHVDELSVEDFGALEIGPVEDEGQDSESKPLQKYEQLDKLDYEIDKCQNSDQTGHNLIVIPNSDSNVNMHCGIQEQFRGHLETEENGQGISEKSDKMVSDEKSLKQILLEIASIGKSIEERMKAKAVCEKCCQAGASQVERGLTVDNSSQTVCVNKETSAAQTLSTGHIAMSGYFME